MKLRLLIIASMCLSSSAYAGGYRVSAQGQQALGMGHTGVAVSQSAEAIFFNPGAISFLDSDTSLTAGVTPISSNTKYQNGSVSTASETDNPPGTPLNFYIAKKMDQASSFSLGVYSPYGNTVEWPEDWAGSHLVNNIALHAIYVQPTVSLKVNDKIGLGFGPTYVSGSVDFNRNLSTSLVDENGDRANVTVNASGVDAWGFNVGLFIKPNKQLAFGVSYRSQVDLHARDEKADFENIPSSMQAQFTDTTFDADLVLPAELTVGFSYDLGSTLIAVDVNRAYWSAYESLDLTFNNTVPESVNPRNYNDVNIYRIGVQQRVASNVVARLGLYYDESPISGGFYTPETARNDSIGFTAGASYAVTSALDIEASFLYLRFEEFHGSYDHFDQSGTTISFAGDYVSSATAFGLGVNYEY